MPQRHLFAGIKLRFAGGVAYLVAMYVLEACSGAPERAALPILTAVPSATPGLRAEALTKIALPTEDARRAGAFLTRIALSPLPTKGPRVTPGPSPTPELGMNIPCGTRTNALAPDLSSCWRGILEGKIVDIQAGRGGMDHDPTVGVLAINVWVGGKWSPANLVLYETPQRLGAVRIQSVDGMRVTLVPADPQAPPVTFVFDLVTRQWLAPPPGPSSSPLASPTAAP